ncbi:MAG: Threonine aldolase [Acidobacteria bacterium]|nr:Threonine aldolase [Acidobacteriota bacterium]
MTIDLRSDTVTLPSPAMRRAMAEAEVGDDVYGEDPTVARLEALAAGMTGKEAALFVTSGTMGNLASLLAHGERGREVILGDESHIFHYENGSASALGGLVLHTVPTRPDGTLPLDSLEAAIRLPAHHYHYYHYAPPGVICLENTHNRCGGRVVAPEYFAEVSAIARRHGIPVHVDGARLFNAAVAAGRPVTDWTRHVDSVQLCLSKGLAAPVGSMICGPAAFVDRARRMRKILGGGMRQAGVIAAPGILALTEMVDRLAEDHANAKILAEGLARVPGVALDPSEVETNIVVFKLPGVEAAAAYAAALEREGVLVSDFGGGRLRVVTHYGIDEAGCRRAVEIFHRAAA